MDWDNKEYVLEEIKTQGAYLLFASNRLKDDYDVVMQAVKQNGDSLIYASDRLTDDDSIVLEAIKQDGYYLLFASDRLRDNYNFILEAVNKNADALIHASIRLQYDINLLRLLRDFHRTEDLDDYKENYIDWYYERMEILKNLELEEELLNSIPENNSNSKVVKF